MDTIDIVLLSGIEIVGIIAEKKAGRIEEGINIAPGGTKVWIIRFKIPEAAPLCIVRYNINVDADNEFYIADSFDINIE